MPDSGSLNLGAWSGDDFSQTVSQSGFVGADSGLPDELRFRCNMTKLVARLFPDDNAMNQEMLPAIFLFCPSPPKEAIGFNPKREPMLNNGIVPIDGRVWFVGPTANSGRYIEYNKLTDDEIFDFVVNSLGAGTSPTVLFDPRAAGGHIRFYPDGLSVEDKCEILELNCPPISVESVRKEIASVYEACLKTPAVQGKEEKLWIDANKHWPIKNAEDRIQTYLRVHLNGAYSTCDILHERPTGPEGRFDIQIVESSRTDQTVKSQHCILELKVLRSFGSTGKSYTEEQNREWTRSGVRQAASYRDSQHATSKWCALVCFDMRRDDEGSTACFEHIEKLAKDCDVKLMRWFLFASTKTLQQTL